MQAYTNYHDDNGNFYYSADASLDIWAENSNFKRFIQATNFPAASLQMRC